MSIEALTPHIELTTGFVLDGRGRIVSTREPQPSPGPLFSLIRSPSACAWAVHAELPEEVATRLELLAREKPPVADLRAAPLHATAYLSLTRGQLGFAGPAFMFPARLPEAGDVVRVEDERLLARHFRGWQTGEIAAGRAPALAVVEDGWPVSVCFCARRSVTAAAAGLETAAAFRGHGLAPRVTAAWASAVRASGRAPLYSAAWSHEASLTVARKLGLTAHASFWSISA